jgi:histidyl-tRNA synthetase
MSTQHSALPGFRDFYPAEMAVRSHIFRAWREVARRYGFEEYDGPPLEPIELFRKDSGAEILEQTYNFVDRGERHVALRPEMTPTLARMVGARAGGLRKPIRWFSVPQLFRYERQQRGRLREHFQLNMDIVGEASVAADAELLAAAIDVQRLLGLTADDVVARVSDRRLLGALLRQAGVPAERLTQVFNLVDKLERDPREAVAARLRDEADLPDDTVERVLEPFDQPDLEAVRTRFGGVEGVAPELERLEEFMSTLAALGLGDFVRFDLTVVRGLGYYTGIVWELFDRQGQLRAIAGGGRYDALLSRVGGEDLPALGFGMGDVVLRELLAERGLLPETGRSVDDFLVWVTAEMRPAMLGAARLLRDAGRSVEYGFKHQGVGRQFKNAAASGAARVIVFGPEELERGEARVREMASGEERTLPLDGLVPD